MQQMDKEADAYAGIDRLLPIRDALQQFEIDVKETQDCLTALLANDDDMAQLMLSENTVRGSVDISRHVVGRSGRGNGVADDRPSDFSRLH